MLSLQARVGKAVSHSGSSIAFLSSPHNSRLACHRSCASCTSCEALELRPTFPYATYWPLTCAWGTPVDCLPTQPETQCLGNSQSCCTVCRSWQGAHHNKTSMETDPCVLHTHTVCVFHVGAA